LFLRNWIERAFFSSANFSPTEKGIQENAAYRWFTADSALVDTGKSIAIHGMNCFIMVLVFTFI
jgi:hypothetical protein